jgi:hypothetical protein
MFRVLRLGEEPNRKIRWLFGGGVAAGVVLLLSGRLAMEHTSSDQFCIPLLTRAETHPPTPNSFAVSCTAPSPSANTVPRGKSNSTLR